MLLRTLAVILGLALGVAGSAAVANAGSKEKAREMAARAVALIEQSGPDAAFNAFRTQAGGWRDRGLYVFVLRADGTMMAHGANTKLVGRNLMRLKDVDGKAFIAEFIAVRDAAWIEYRWRNPQTQVVEAKTSYIVRVGDYLVGVEAYAG